MDESETNGRDGKRRWFRMRFGLWTFLIAVAILSVFLGWFGKELIRVRRQRAITERLSVTGATFYYSFDVKDGVTGNEPPPAPKVLRWLFGDDLYTEVSYVHWNYNSQPTAGDVALLQQLPALSQLGLYGPSITNDALAHIPLLRNLEGLSLQEIAASPDAFRELASCQRLDQLSLYGNYVTDQHLRAMSNCERLRSLQIVRTPSVSDDGLAEVAALRNLESLDVFQAPSVTDKGVSAISELPRLRSLILLGTKVTDASLEHVGKLRSLERLGLHQHPISDQGIRHLAGLARLTSLQLSYTNISDASMSTIGSLSNLNELDLSGTVVTDKGLQELHGLAKLTRLQLMATKVSDEGIMGLKHNRSLQYLDVTLGDSLPREAVRALKEHLPNCRIGCWRIDPVTGSTSLEATE